MTAGFDLWRWFEQTIREPQTRASGEVVIYAQDGQTRQATFVLERCLPLKVKAPPFNAREGIVAIEELQVTYESLRLREEDGHG
jgi:phage tail-like protein